MESVNPKEMMYSVDGNKPASFVELVKINLIENESNISSIDLISILSLKIGETYKSGLAADVERVADNIN